jgi:hypothetical protein
MHFMKLLHETFKKELPFVHQSRLKNLTDAVTTLIKINKLTLTALGRHFPKKIKVRSKIKKMDRLISNSHIQEEAVEFYKVMNRYLIRENGQPWIHVDWSCLCSVTKMYLLRATLSMQGRSIIIYEECHPKKKENNHATHKAFLNQLKRILGSSVKPVIVTDAGFRAPWFAYVRRIGWDFVGRLRNKNAIKFNNASDWILSKSLYGKATGTPQYLGEGILTEKEKVAAHFILYKEKPKNRTHKARSRRSGNTKRYIKANKEPWLLVTSLTATDIEKQTVNIYRQRMRIEENIRDTKCTRYGFGLKESRSRSTERMKILLLIAAIATFACWLAGIFMREKGNDSAFQAQSSKHKGVLSIVYLGREALKEGIRIGKRQFEKLLQLLFDINNAAQLETACYE